MEYVKLQLHRVNDRHHIMSNLYTYIFLCIVAPKSAQGRLHLPESGKKAQQLRLTSRRRLIGEQHHRPRQIRKDAFWVNTALLQQRKGFNFTYQENIYNNKNVLL